MGRAGHPIGAFMEQARRRKGFSRERLGAAIGVNSKTIYRWERDQDAPGVDDVMAIAGELGVGLDELLWGRKDAADVRAEIDELKETVRGLVHRVDEALGPLPEPPVRPSRP